MSAPEPATPTPPADDDAAVNAVLSEFAGDHRQAIAALLHDINTMVADARSAVSHGYVRGIDLTEWTKRRRAL